jgi:acetoin utilization deacetylase AcuC-like enzyme
MTHSSPEIPIIYPIESLKYMPQVEVHRGDEMENADRVGRIFNIIEYLRLSGYSINQADCIDGSKYIGKVHSGEYLDFLKRASEAVRDKPSLDPQVDGEIPAIYASVFPYSGNKHTRSIEGAIGMYAFDTYTAIIAESFNAANASAQAAIVGAHMLLNGDPIVYALTRPPGHHAMRDKMGGYCYLNNAAIAAEFLRDKGVNKIAIFDPDLHHGNGIQEHFYDRQDVLYVSIHGDPTFCYPFYSGFSDETGEGQGAGTNLNIPLGYGTGERKYDDAVTQSLRKITEFKPDAMIIAMGFDTHAEDLFHTFRLSTKYYGRLAQRIGNIGLRTLVLQEGGYTIPLLGQNVVSFLNGFNQ